MTVRTASEINAEIGQLRDIDVALRDRIAVLAEERQRIEEDIRDLHIELDAANKIPDSVAWVPSFTRNGNHLTVVVNGEGFCTCEDARYRNPTGGCKHFNAATAAGYHDNRATFRGGFDGPVDLFERRGVQVPQFIYDALIGINH